MARTRSNEYLKPHPVNNKKYFTVISGKGVTIMMIRARVCGSHSVRIHWARSGRGSVPAASGWQIHGPTAG